ncbi:sensor histidine kinase [Streptomyces sp. NPDC002004]
MNGTATTLRRLTRHPAVLPAAKLLLAAALVLLVTVEGVALARQPSGPHAVAWASGIVVCLCAVPWARIPLLPRARTAATVSWLTTIYLFTSNRPQVVWGVGEAIALLVLLHGVLVHAPARSAAVLGPLLALATMAAPVRDATPGRFTLAFAVLTVMVTTVALLLRAKNSQRIRDLQAVRTAERLELSRELHDLVAHHVTGIVVQARAARFAGVDAEHAAATFARIEAAGDEALGAMRRLVRVLREGEPERAPTAGIAEIHELAETFSRTGPPALVHIDPGLQEHLPADLAAAAHRIVRESLTNVRKHAAEATAVRIGLRTVPGGLEIRVTDDGSAPASDGADAGDGGFGLAGLTERATALGGHLTAGRPAEGGWEVRAVLPYDTS